MGCLSSWFFTWVQAAPAYRALHEQALALVPPGTGQSWLDLGSGAGIVARLAWRRGYLAHGTDADAAMVRRARGLVGRQPGPSFEHAALAELVRQGRKAQVVSAASLLQVVPDAREALSQMLQLVAPGGLALVMETGARMAEGRLPRAAPCSHSGAVMALWHRSRRGRPPLDLAALCLPGWVVQRTSLMDGALNVWQLRRLSD